MDGSQPMMEDESQDIVEERLIDIYSLK